jgi:ABC-2 type transport system ATP-binding protein
MASGPLPVAAEPPRAGVPLEISCRSVTAGYLGTPVLRDISFTVHEPAIYVVLGPNGAGKTTLLRTIAGILRPYAGEVSVAGSPSHRQSARDSLHYLSHIDGLPDGLRMREALEWYARVEGAGPADVDRVLGLLDIRDLSEQYFPRLSAGQRKRVAIARIFLQERGIYLLDEPTSNLDPKAAREIRSLILELSREKIVLYSSHNLFEAREIGRYVIAIREGRLALFDRIEDMRTARYVVGIRLLEPSEAVRGLPQEGNYFLRELPGPQEVPALLRDLESRGAKVREIREMGNPLEELFT